MELNQKVQIIDIEATKQDVTLETLALQIMAKSEFTGEITKIDGDLFFVGFKNDLGWVTQGFYADEIKEVK